MDIIGLGEAGCNIAECFRKYPQYNIYKIDVGMEGDKCFNVPKQKSPEDYEKNTPSFRQFFGGLRDEVFFIVGGSGLISGMSLSILEQIRGKKVSLLYIKPNPKSISGKKKLLERAACGILQQYARSGLLEEMIIMNNDLIAKQIGNLPVIGYYDKINNVIVSAVHFINVFNRTKHIYGSVEEKDPVNRITTIGLLDPRTSGERMFCNLDLIREKSYFYAFNKNELLNETNLINTIENHMEEKREMWLTKISYRLYSTEYENELGYCVYRTSKIQGEQ